MIQPMKRRTSKYASLMLSVMLRALSKLTVMVWLAGSLKLLVRSSPGLVDCCKTRVWINRLRQASTRSRSSVGNVLSLLKPKLYYGGVKS